MRALANAVGVAMRIKMLHNYACWPGNGFACPIAWTTYWHFIWQWGARCVRSPNLWARCSAPECLCECVCVRCLVLVDDSRTVCLGAQLRLSTQMLITALVSSGRVVLNLVLPTNDITNTSANARKCTPMRCWCMCAEIAQFFALVHPTW